MRDTLLYLIYSIAILMAADIGIQVWAIHTASAEGGGAVTVVGKYEAWNRVKGR